MSDGTVDQLYLALRLASVDEYLGRAHSLPFIADDLLINFDDARAAAGFKVLAELGQKTQVLFFTHHQHLRRYCAGHVGQRQSTLFLLQGIKLLKRSGKISNGMFYGYADPASANRIRVIASFCNIVLG